MSGNTKQWTAGGVARWVWKIILVAATIWFVWWFFFATYANSQQKMLGELQHRAFGKIEVIHHPTRFSDLVLGSSGTYSATVGNCRFTITTDDGVPVVIHAPQDGAEIVIRDADMTRLVQTPQLARCFG